MTLRPSQIYIATKERKLLEWTLVMKFYIYIFYPVGMYVLMHFTKNVVFLRIFCTVGIYKTVLNTCIEFYPKEI